MNTLAFTANAHLICGHGVLFLRYCLVVNIILWTSLNKARCESSPHLYSLWQFILHFIMPHKQGEMKTRSMCEHLWVTNNAIGWFDGLSDWFRRRQISLAGCVWVRVTCSHCTRLWNIFRIWLILVYVYVWMLHMQISFTCWSYERAVNISDCF